MKASRRTIVLGAGLAGLGAARRHPEALVAEAADDVGGLCASSVVDGFTFDRAGHVWHFAEARVRRAVEDWLGMALRPHRRRAAVSYQGRLLPYPFQLALGRLPADAAQAAREGLLRAAAEAGHAGPRTPRPHTGVDSQAAPGAGAAGETLERACLARYGEGITRLFVDPYHEKLLGCTPADMLADPLIRFMPDPGVATMLASLREDQAYEGYNAEFRHVPGGCGRVCDALAATTPGLRRDARATALDCAGSTVTVGDSTERFHRLVATIPLRDLALMTVDLPAPLREAATALRAAAVVVVNLGVAGPPVHDLHWVYVPEPEHPFYRVGWYSNFAPECCPAGCHAMYVELPASWWDTQPEPARLPGVLSALERCGFVDDGRRVVTAEVLRLDPAYVVPTREATAARDALLAWYAERGVVLHGRYALWSYLAMDDVVAASLVI